MQWRIFCFSCSLFYFARFWGCSLYCNVRINTIEVHVEQHNEYNVDGKDLDEAKVVAIINTHALDNANEPAQLLAKELMKALANRPAKGRA